MKKTIKSEVICCENVRPSSPTPPHLQTYKLSMLDQISVLSPVPIVLYFANTADNIVVDCHNLFAQKIEHLKTCLSSTLTLFYPVAGRTSGDCRYINCNDEGVPFSVVNMKGYQLSDLLKPHPNPELWGEIVPCNLARDVEWGPPYCSVVAMIRITHFDCGGIAIATVFWHKVGDAATISLFLKHWAAICSRAQPGPGPNYMVQSLFPPKDELWAVSSSSMEHMKKGKYITKHCVFDKQTILLLKAWSGVQSPTRVEVVTAFLWKCFMIASLANKNAVSTMVHGVNLRRRARPPFPPEYLGNLVALTTASCTNNENSEIHLLVNEMRNATSKIDDEYINRMKGDKGFVGLCENQKLIWSQVPKGADLLVFSSWCGMGFYEVDFGWGKPVWLTVYDGSESSIPFINLIHLLDTKLCDGVEAWVILEEKYMQVFEIHVQELKTQVSLLSTNK